MEEIRAHCGILSIGSEPERGGSYVWLRECEPFTAVMRNLQRHGLTFIQTAALLAPGAAGPLTDSALELLSAAIMECPRELAT